MNDWEKLNETSIPKKVFYSNLNMEYITDAEYKHTKRNLKELEIKKESAYYNLYNQSDKYLVADVFENFRNLCLAIYGLDPAHVFSSPRLPWQPVFKKVKVKLELLTNTDILIMVEKDITSGICHTNRWYLKANNKYMKDHNPNKKLSYLINGDINNLYENTMSQKLPRWFQIGQIIISI